MAQVSVSISGKMYRMACDDGQEEHLERLAEGLDQTIDRLREQFGEIGDQRLTVMAAITVSDEKSGLERRLSQLEETIAGLERGQAEILEREHAHDEAIARSIDTVAERVKALAVRLTDASGGGNGS